MVTVLLDTIYWMIECQAVGAADVGHLTTEWLIHVPFSLGLVFVDLA